MLNQTFFYTALFSTIFMGLALKFMELFSFINWSPIGWGEKAAFVSPMHDLVKWALLCFILFLAFMLLYSVMFYLPQVPPAMSAIFFTMLLIFMVEWLASEKKEPLELIQEMSIPLLAVTAIILRFISGTAVFYQELSKK